MCLDPDIWKKVIIHKSSRENCQVQETNSISLTQNLVLNLKFISHLGLCFGKFLFWCNWVNWSSKASRPLFDVNDGTWEANCTKQGQNGFRTSGKMDNDIFELEVLILGPDFIDQFVCLLLFTWSVLLFGFGWYYYNYTSHQWLVIMQRFQGGCFCNLWFCWCEQWCWDTDCDSQ